MKRRLLNGLAALSLILALATGGLWGRSYYRFDRWVNESSPRERTHVESWEGTLIIAHAPIALQPFNLQPPNWRTWAAFAVGTDTVHVRLKSRHAPEPEWIRSGPVLRAYVIRFPHWTLLLAFAILPAFRGWQLLRSARRRSENLCPQCGYDLRATPQRCPECGKQMESEVVE